MARRRAKIEIRTATELVFRDSDAKAFALVSFTSKDGKTLIGAKVIELR